jgi:hypothetical protein
MVGMQGNYHCISGSMSLHLPCNPRLVLLPVFEDQKGQRHLVQLPSEHWQEKTKLYCAKICMEHIFFVLIAINNHIDMGMNESFFLLAVHYLVFWILPLSGIHLFE